MARPFEQASIQAGDVSAMAVMNMAVNGFNAVSQENGDTAVALPNNVFKYTTDQMIGVVSGSMGVQAQRVAAPFPSMLGIVSGLKLTCSTAAALGASDFVLLNHSVEGNRIGKLAWGTALGLPLTLGFVIRPSYPLVIYVAVSNGPVNTRKRLTRYACPANQETFIKLQFDPETTGAWNTNNTEGLTVGISFGAGSGKLGTPDQWLTSSAPMAGADVTNLCAVAGQSVIVSGLVLFPGIVPLSKEVLPLIARHLPDEEDLCLRYWERNTNLGLYGSAGPAGGLNATYYALKKRKRIVPILSFVQTGQYGINSSAIAAVNADTLSLQATPSANASWGVTWEATMNARM